MMKSFNWFPLGYSNYVQNNDTDVNQTCVFFGQIDNLPSGSENHSNEQLFGGWCSWME